MPFRAAIGLLGGSFNPPHAAHLALALAAQQQLGLQRVELLPAGLPWQKKGVLIASAAQRLAMCRLLIAGYPQLGVEPCETQRAGNTYTVDTLRELRAANPQQTYVFILGADQLANFDSWHDWPAVLQHCTLAVTQRAGQAVGFPQAVQGFMQLHSMGWLRVNLPAMAVSSTQLRAQMARGESTDAALPPSVARYINEHGLYHG